MAELTIEQLAQGKANQAATCEQDVIVPQDATVSLYIPCINSTFSTKAVLEAFR
jgi:hypothetical protein